jgi:hypothetical protein
MPCPVFCAHDFTLLLKNYVYVEQYLLVEILMMLSDFWGYLTKHRLIYHARTHAHTHARTHLDTISCIKSVRIRQRTQLRASAHIVSVKVLTANVAQCTGF